MDQSQAGASLITSILPIIILWIPIFIANIILAIHKGRSIVKYALLSFIPIGGFVATIYLMSKLDKSIEDKIDFIVEFIKSKDNSIK